MELSQLQAFKNFMKFNSKWEFQVDGVNFIFSLQKIRSFWYNASFEFSCQILWVYNYYALKIMFFLVIACLKDPHRRIFVEHFCCLLPIFLRPLHFQLFPHNLITRVTAFLFQLVKCYLLKKYQISWEWWKKCENH